MHTWRKDLPREDKSTKNSTPHPSFSSTLLDEIYRSIDKNNVENQGVKPEKVGKINNKKPKEDEEMASHIRACLVEKWMEKKINEKISIKRPPLLPNFEKDLHPFQDNDPMFFSSSSASSDSSSGGLSSSDSEFFAAAKTRKSCFAAPWPKPIKTKVSSKQSHPPLPQAKAEELMKSRSRNLKIYGDLKNVKQPISPGGRLTSLINSLFTNGSSKKSKNFNYNVSSKTEERKSRSTQTSTCSSAASFSRSCLSKTPTSSRNKVDKRTVSFYPVSVIVDEECRPCGHKGIDDINVMGSKEKKMESKKIEYQSHKKDDFMVQRWMDEDEDEEAASDCSSDLFEIDHLGMFGNTRFCEELPVYETTHLDKNLAIASGRIR